MFTLRITASLASASLMQSIKEVLIRQRDCVFVFKGHTHASIKGRILAQIQAGSG